jgi:M6 family metalloprotease-like protein
MSDLTQRRDTRALGILLATAWLAAIVPAAARPLDAWACAGVAPPSVSHASAKAVASLSESPSAVVIFGHFADEGLPDTPPVWSADLLDADRPGSVAHFYDIMSFGRHRLRGEIAPHRYASAHAADSYGPTATDTLGQYGRFALEILRQADADIDFSRYDNDGPDGTPNSGDDDGVVDVVFINIEVAPSGFLFRDATGIADLGFEVPFETDDVGASGSPIRIDPESGTLQAVTSFDHAAGVMAHEYGHLLGLRDLYDVEWTDNPSTPENDSAGIGRWGLMGWGATGWPGALGPTSLSAWSRLRLGWAQLHVVAAAEDSVCLPPVADRADLVQIPLNVNEFYLVEYRQRDAFYDRGIPGEGLLIWHVSRAMIEGELALWWDVDLESADGLWRDAGYPAGGEAAPMDGGDNLDFWAHDGRYAEAHEGNLGDATDPFDGVRWQRFALDTNPSAAVNGGVDAVAIDQIVLTDEGASFLVETNPPRIEVRGVAARASRVTAGTALAIIFEIANIGGTPAPALRAELQSASDIIELVTPSLELYPLDVGASSVGRGVGPSSFPLVRFPKGLAEETRAEVDFVVFAGPIEVARQTVEITGVPSHELTVQVVNEDGTPVEGVHVNLPGTNPQADLHFDSQHSSDSTGTVSFHLPPGIYTRRRTRR